MTILANALLILIAALILGIIWLVWCGDEQRSLCTGNMGESQ